MGLFVNLEIVYHSPSQSTGQNYTDTYTEEYLRIDSLQRYN